MCLISKNWGDNMFKIVISEPKSRKAWQIEKEVPSLIGKKIGDNFEGSVIGLSGFTLQITGGSDKDGFPMRPDLLGTLRKKALLTKGIGFRGRKKIKKKVFKVKGMRKRKYIRGNTISTEIIQVNCKIIEGEGDIPKILGIKPKEEKTEEAPKEEVKPEVKEEKPKEKKPEPEKAPEKVEEKPKEEPKPEEKPAEKPEEPKQEEKKEGE
jgi:small subunit ribosomal protein S6e